MSNSKKAAIVIILVVVFVVVFQTTKANFINKSIIHNNTVGAADSFSEDDNDNLEQNQEESPLVDTPNINISDETFLNESTDHNPGENPISFPVGE